VSGSLVLICLLLGGPQAPPPGADLNLHADRAAARAVLNDVLSQRAFTHSRGQTWEGAMGRWVEDRLTALWARLTGSRFAVPSAPRAVAWIASILAFGVLMAWLWRIVKRSRSAGTFELHVPVRDERRWRALAQEAVDLIRAGQIRDGARLAYRAAVQRLEEEGAFTHDTTRTPREYLQLVPARHRSRPALTTLTKAFERIWYGSTAASPDEGREIMTLLQDLECLPREQAN
jgi:hypothetical protein